MSQKKANYKVYTFINIPELNTNQVFYLGYDESGEFLQWYADEKLAHITTGWITHEEREKEIRETFPNLKSKIYFEEIEN